MAASINEIEGTSNEELGRIEAIESHLGMLADLFVETQDSHGEPQWRETDGGS